MAKQFILGSIVGAVVILAVLGGTAAALGHPIPHLYKKVDKKNVKLSGIYWTLSPSGATDASGVVAGISVSQAKQIADVLKTKIFQQGVGGSVSFVANPINEIVDAADSAYYLVAV